MIRQVFIGVLSSTLILLLVMPVTALEVTMGTDADLLADTLPGLGVTILPGTSSYQGTPAAVGTFSDDGTSGLGLTAGIIIRSDPPASGNLSEPNILEFDFTTETHDLFCRYILASEEYDADGGSLAYSDILILYVDGKQAALLPDNVTPAAINLVNAGQNWDYFRDNREQQFDLPYSGFTSVLTAVATGLDPDKESHHFKLLVMNQGDPHKQSAMLLEHGSCSAYGLSVEDVTANEDAGTMTFTVNLSNPTTAIVNFDYHTDDDTAIAGSDYTTASGTSGIASGSQSAQITVEIADDVLNENDETFFVKLSNVTNATLVTPDGIGTIFDNDELPALAITDATAEEITETITFTVSLSAPSSQDVSVDYSTVDDTATAGEDYTVTQGTLTIPAGESSATIEVTLTDDPMEEDEEIFIVALSNPMNAELANDQGRGTIQDDDDKGLLPFDVFEVPEPSTFVLVMLGLLGIGWLTRRRRR